MTLIGNVQDLGIDPYASIFLNFKLVGHMGTQITSQVESSFVPKIKSTSVQTDANGDFSVTLEANEAYRRKTYYKLEVEDRTFFLYIPKNADKVNIRCVLNEIDYDGIATVSNLALKNTYVYTTDFLQKFEKFILNIPQALTRAEESMCEKFVSTASFNEDEKSPDVIELNKQLGSL